MRLVDVIAYAVADYWDNKFKTLLSCLGIIIGVAAIITLLTVSAGVFSGLTDRFSNIETDTILITPHAYSGVGSVLTERGTVARTHLPPAQFTDEDVALLRNTSGVAAVYPEISTAKEVAYLNDTEYVQAVKAVVPGMSRYADMVRSGRYLAANDTYAVVIGSAVAEGMFLDDVKAGSSLTIYSSSRDRSQKYTVVGVLRQINTSSVSGDPNSAIYMTRA
ncbi:MAG TPA: ABC transporter permease, partial [Methanocella sp.]|nr:ABC transporter permease [Methanocella sp.]